jgi:hypothetical protein
VLLVSFFAARDSGNSFQHPEMLRTPELLSLLATVIAEQAIERIERPHAGLIENSQEWSLSHVCFRLFAQVAS